MNTPMISRLLQQVMNWKHRTTNNEHRTPNHTLSGTAFDVVSSLLNVRCFLLAGLLLFALPGLAGVPQPMCVYYGEALDGYGLPYTTNAEVVLLHGTNEIASQIIQGSLTPGVNFALYVHLDDGSSATSYSPRALHSGDLVSIVVRDQDGEKTIMEEQAVPPVGKPGEMVMINVTAAQDSDGDGLPDAWEEELIYWSFGALHNITDVHPGDDFDGDGQSNLAEYRAGTFAFLNYDYFYAEQFGLTLNGRLAISLLSVPGKLYGVRYVTDMKQTQWTASPLAVSDTADFQTQPIEGTGDWLTLYVPAELSHAFFRPTVETFTSYAVTATHSVTSLLAKDNAGNDPYPTTKFQSADNGGMNFEPWQKLEGSLINGSRFLGGSIGDSTNSWGLSGTYAVGRGLPGTAHHGLWQIRMVHDPDNTDFSGFNLKSAAVSGFGETEIIRMGMTTQPIASIGKGISISTDGGTNYTFHDCGWEDGRGDSVLYQFYWDESGSYTLTVVNSTEGITSQFTGTMLSSAVTLMGVGVLGASATETIQFDSLSFQTDPSLTMQQAGNDLVLSWPAGFAGYTLQSSFDLNQAGGWTSASQNMQSADGLNWVSIPMTNQQRFFRLSK